jgi:hypothetical protein
MVKQGLPPAVKKNSIDTSLEDVEIKERNLKVLLDRFSRPLL